MLTPFQTELMPAFAKASVLTRKEVFGDDVKHRPDRPRNSELWHHDSVADVGFVGPKAQKHGILFLGINPGNSSAKGGDATQSDKILFKAKVNFRNNPTEELFERLMVTAVREAQNWPIVRNYCPIDLAEISYLNVVPFRTRDGSKTANKYLVEGFTLHLHSLISAVAPRAIIARGVMIGKEIQPRVRNVEWVILSGERSLSSEKRAAQHEQARQLCQRMLAAR